MNTSTLQIAHINLHTKPELHVTEALVEKLVTSVEDSQQFNNPAVILNGADNISIMLDFYSTSEASFERSFFTMIKELGFGSFTLKTTAAAAA